MTSVALIGNPNCGKTTLFNLLTGARQKVGNWAGVTTEKKDGIYNKNKSVKIIDLPGLYSLTAVSKDERAVSDYLKNSAPDVIINIVDGTNLERNLYLTTEIIDAGIPVVVAVNMADDLEKNGIEFNARKLSETLGVKVVPISAIKNKNVEYLMNVALSEKTSPKPMDFSAEQGDCETAKRYSFLSREVKKCIMRKSTVAQNFTVKADNILTHKYLGIPIFFIVITLVYFLSFNVGGVFSGIIGVFFDRFSINTQFALLSVNASEWLASLVGAVINGVGSVMEFLPQILVLFFMLALLEESGYMSRVAFNLDRLFRFFGLGGKSVIPLVLSCGCTVTGLMATRTIENEAERVSTVILAPFMPCGAKIAVFGWFSYVFFGGSALIAASLFFLGILAVCVFGRALKRFGEISSDNGFLLEMPTYRLPSFKSVFFVLWEKVKDFCVKAGTVVFAVSVILWLFTNFGIHGYTSGNAENGFLYYIGNVLKYFFYPLGFGNWQSAVAILSGLLAKEAVIETLGALCGNVEVLFRNDFSVYAFMSFVLLSPPCVASVMQAKRELKSGKTLAFMLVFETLSAYIVALVINIAGFFAESVSRLLFFAIIVIIITLFIISLKKLFCVRSCGGCGRRNAKCPKR